MKDKATKSSDSTDDRSLAEFGYTQQYRRTLRSFQSFAIAFSFISITTGIFSTYGFALTTGGPRAIWTWWIVIAGQTLVAIVYGALAAKIPLSGYSYQWATRLANATVGWWIGWVSFAFLSIVTVSVDYGLVTTAIQPLLGITTTPLNAAVWTVIVLIVQAILIVASTVTTSRVNAAAVATELLGILGLTVALIIAAAVRHVGHWSNLVSTGVVSHAGYYGRLGPFMLATLLGAYTIVGFEGASNLAEETHEPRRVVPKAMIQAVLLSGILGFAFLMSLSYAMKNISAATASSAPVSFIIHNVLGGPVEKIFLVFVCVSIFACGLVIMVTNTRLVWSMARDKRLPGHHLWRQVPRATGGPSWATVLVTVIGILIVVALRNDSTALATLFTASAIMPALLYASTVILYISTRHRYKTESGFFHPGRFEVPVVVGALVWLAYELIVLLCPAEFRSAQYYVLGSLGVGVIVYIAMLFMEPQAMRSTKLETLSESSKEPENRG